MYSNSYYNYGNLFFLKKNLLRFPSSRIHNTFLQKVTQSHKVSHVQILLGTGALVQWKLHFQLHFCGFSYRAASCSAVADHVESLLAKASFLIIDMHFKSTRDSFQIQESIMYLEHSNIHCTFERLPQDRVFWYTRLFLGSPKTGDG